MVLGILRNRKLIRIITPFVNYKVLWPMRFGLYMNPTQKEIEEA